MVTATRLMPRQGTIIGNGVGIVVLKRLTDAIADGDCIHAIKRFSNQQ